MSMRRGRARKKVQFQKRTTGTSDRGAPVDDWADHVTRYCAVEPLNGDKFMSEFGANNDIDTRIRVRWDPKLAGIQADPKDYSAVIDGIRYEIRAPINDELRNRDLVLACTRGGAIYA